MELWASGYNDLPPLWVFDFFRWLIIVACVAPFALVLFLFLMWFIQLCIRPDREISDDATP